MAAVSSFLGEFRLRFPEVTDTIGLIYLNKALRRLAFRVPFRRVDVGISLTATIPEYELPVAITRIEEVYYETSNLTSGWSLLAETSVEELSMLNRAWRTTAPAIPTHYYRSSASTTGDSTKAVIGLYPRPNAGGGSGHPLVRVYGAGQADLDLSDTIPSNLLNEEGLLDVMSLLYAKDRKRDEIGIWLPLAEKALGENVQSVKEGSSEGTTVLMPGYAPASRGA